MFYLISHNKASLWTAINCVWIFPLRRNRELSERAPVPQAAFILMQRSIAIFIAGSITHVTVVLWAGATSQKEAWQHHHRGLQNDTALIAEQGRRGLGGGFFFFLEARRDAFRYVTVRRLHLHVSLLFGCVGAAGDIQNHAGSIRRTAACCWSLAWVVSIWLPMEIPPFFPLILRFLHLRSRTVALTSHFSHINVWLRRQCWSFIRCTHLLCISLWEKSNVIAPVLHSPFSILHTFPLSKAFVMTQTRQTSQFWWISGEMKAAWD